MPKPLNEKRSRIRRAKAGVPGTSEILPQPIVWIVATVRLMAAMLILSLGGIALGQEGFVSREYEIKAAYLYNFGKYVSWPAAATKNADAFVIGVVGNSPIHGKLVEAARAKTLHSRPLAVKRFAEAAEYTPCHMLFVPAGQDPALTAAILKRIGLAPTLVVGEEAGFASRDGMIGFYIDGNNVRFEVNPRAAEATGLTISSKLLTLGRIVGS